MPQSDQIDAQLIRTMSLAITSMPQFDQTILIRYQIDAIVDHIDASADEDGEADSAINARFDRIDA